MIRIMLAAGVAAVVLVALSSCGNGSQVKEPDGGSKNAGGQVINSSKSVASIDTYRSWSKDPRLPSGKAYSLAPGKKTSSKIDTDGLCVGPDYVAELSIKLGPLPPRTETLSVKKACKKINDWETVTVTVKSR